MPFSFEGDEPKWISSE